MEETITRPKALASIVSSRTVWKPSTAQYRARPLRTGAFASAARRAFAPGRSSAPGLAGSRVHRLEERACPRPGVLRVPDRPHHADPLGSRGRHLLDVLRIDPANREPGDCRDL